MSTPIRPYLQIHLCVLLWGFTAILGKLISLPAGALVFWRMAIVAGVLALAPRVWRALRATPRAACPILVTRFPDPSTKARVPVIRGWGLR